MSGKVDRSVVKAVDGLFATHVSGPIAYGLVCRLVDTKVTPNQVTALSFALMLVAALLATRGTFAANVLAVAAVQVSFVLDMVDGQLARARGGGSAFGAFLDEFTDRVREAALYAGVAIGAGERAQIWPLAYGALAVVLIRHVGDLALAARFGLSPERERELSEEGLITRSVRAAGLADPRGGLVESVKTFLWFSIGDRLALLSLALLAMRPEAYFWLVILVGAPSFFGRLAQKLWRLRAR